MWADCLENVGASASHNSTAFTASYRGSFTFLFFVFWDFISDPLLGWLGGSLSLLIEVIIIEKYQNQRNWRQEKQYHSENAFSNSIKLNSVALVPEELLEWKGSGSGSRKSRLTAVGIRCADHAAPLSAKVGTNFADKRRSLGQYSVTIYFL
jgi:hypothetical protein